jgi:hypothetical protein
MTIYGKSEKTKRVILWGCLALIGVPFIIAGYWPYVVGYWGLIAALFIGDFIKKKKNRI